MVVVVGDDRKFDETLFTLPPLGPLGFKSTVGDIVFSK